MKMVNILALNFKPISILMAFITPNPVLVPLSNKLYPYTPQQNGIAESKHIHITKTALFY